MLRLCYRVAAAGVSANLAVNLLLPAGVPWSVLPIALLGMGVSLGFPTLSLMVLDRFPATRGAGSSLQTALSLLLMSLISGLLSPLVAHQPLALALCSAGLSGIGYLCWRRGRRHEGTLAVTPALA
jgi:DHA1 family bicyclomycin/chloramphenicol resistance-like MFS transporter